RLRREQIQLTRDMAAAAAAAQGGTDIVAQINASPVPPKTRLGWLLAVVGGLIATCGGFFSLLLLLYVAHNWARADLAGAIRAGWFLGGIPLLIGLVMFVSGVKRIHAKRRKAPLAAAVAAASAAG